ncbi:MAG: VOC family protein [Bacteroidota bacterium]
MNRKEFIAIAGMFGMGTAVNGFSLEHSSKLDVSNPAKNLIMLDHILLGVSDLQKGIQLVKEKTGVEAAEGGKHPNIGTHNALISLGENQYLEIIAPNPGEKLIDEYSFLKDLKEPSVFTWAVHTNNMEEVLKKINAAGYKNYGISDGSRLTKEGKKLSWRSLGMEVAPDDGLIPFFIEWGKDTVHPSITSPKGCKLQSLELTHPKPVEIETVLKNAGIPLSVEKGSKPQLKLTIQSPRGTVTF